VSRRKENLTGRSERSERRRRRSRGKERKTTIPAVLAVESSKVSSK